MGEGIKAEGTENDVNQMPDEIQKLLLESIDKNALPYIAKEPLPQDMNVISGKRMSDANKILLELKAAAIGAKSLEWIYEKDAEALALEAKKQAERFDIEPITCYANVSRDGGKTYHIETQKAYLLGQFTDESVARAMNPEKVIEKNLVKNDEEAKKLIALLSRRFIKNHSEYHTGFAEEKIRSQMKANVKENYNPQNETSKKVTEAYNKITKNLSADQKIVSQAMVRHYTKQTTGLDLKSQENEEDIKKSFRKITKDKNALMEVMTAVLFFSDRTFRKEFSLGQVERKNGRTTAILPFAARIEDRAKLKRERELAKQREKQFKPRARTMPAHERGGR